MADLKIRRGTQAQLPSLTLGEPGFTTDTKRLYIGDGVGNNLIGPADGATLSGVPRTLLELNDTPSTYDNGKYLQSTAAGSFWAAIAGVAGPKGADGGEWVSGAGVPTSATGTLNNFYLDTSTGDIYRKELTATGTAQYGVMLAREADGSYTFADAVRFVKTSHEVIVDNLDAEFSVTGSWSLYNTSQAWANSCRYATSDYTAQANFSFVPPADGEYDVYAYWPVLGAAATNAPFMITHVSGTTTIRKSQRIGSPQWTYLSTHTFDGSPSWVWKMNIKGADGSTTFLGLTDTPSSYDNGKYLRSTSSGVEFVDISLGNYYTKTEVDTISGSLQSGIDSHVSSTANPHSVTLEQARIAGNTISSNNSINFRDGNSIIYSSTADELTLGATNEVVVERDLHVDRDLYVDHRFTINGGTAVEIIRDEDDMGHDDPHALITQQSAKAYVDNSITTFSGTIDHDTVLNTHNLTTDIDHDLLTNFEVNEHFTEASIDHVNINSIGTNTHAQIDTHISDTTIHFTDFVDLADTPSAYDDEKHLVSTTSGLDFTPSVTVVGGDVYFVDTTRSNKKLGVSMFDIGCGRNSSNTTNQYLRTYNGTPMNQSGIPLLFNATLIGISMAEDVNTQSWRARVRRNDSTTNVYSHQLVNAYEVHSFTVDVDFNEGDRIQIYLSGNSIDYPQVRTYWRRRF